MAEQVNAPRLKRHYDDVVRKQLINPLSAWLMENSEAVHAFAAENGGARIVIESLENLKPQLLAPSEQAVAASNDNAEKADKKVSYKKKKGGPSL